MYTHNISQHVASGVHIHYPLHEGKIKASYRDASSGMQDIHIPYEKNFWLGLKFGYLAIFPMAPN